MKLLYWSYFDTTANTQHMTAHLLFTCVLKHTHKHIFSSSTDTQAKVKINMALTQCSGGHLFFFLFHSFLILSTLIQLPRRLCHDIQTLSDTMLKVFIKLTKNQKDNKYGLYCFSVNVSILTITNDCNILYV